MSKGDLCSIFSPFIQFFYGCLLCKVSRKKKNQCLKWEWKGWNTTKKIVSSIKDFFSVTLFIYLHFSAFCRHFLHHCLIYVNHKYFFFVWKIYGWIFFTSDVDIACWFSSTSLFFGCLLGAWAIVKYNIYKILFEGGKTRHCRLSLSISVDCYCCLCLLICTRLKIILVSLLC